MSIQPAENPHTITHQPTTVEDHPSTAYHAGCLLGLLQQIQDSDDGEINATYTDRYFNSASECPVRVLPRLVELALKRNRRLFQTNPRLSIDYRHELIRLHSRVKDHLPGRLNMHGKADFQLGYFHQMASRLPGKDRDHVRYRTDDGQSVKSKGEVAIANALHRAGIDYQYETKVSCEDDKGNEIVMFPDFTVVTTNYTLWIEYLGMLTDSGYASRWIGKLRSYERDLRCRQWADVITDGNVSERVLMTIEPDEADSIEKIQRLIENVQRWQSMVS